MKCSVCRNTRLTRFLDLGHQPPSDAFLRFSDLTKPEVTYPLALYFCHSCFLVQLGYVVDPDILFKEYVYNSGTNNSLKVNFKQLVDSLVARFELTGHDLAIDIGSNDGTLLENYREHDVRILGIDPSSVTSIALKRGILTVVDFFSGKLAARVRKKHGRARVITATNVFAHVPRLADFVGGVKKLLTEDGVFVSESGYLLDLIEKNQYDSIYHEHLRYYSILSLTTLFKNYSLEIFDVERISTHNGSVRVYAAKPGAYPRTKRLTQLLALEKRKGLHRLKTMQKFSQRVTAHRLALQSQLLTLKHRHKTIVGIGAPAKGNTLLNSCRLGDDIINYLTEKSDLKIGLFSPGQHIPVVSEERMFKDQPDYALILSWNIANELVSKLRAKGYRGTFIIPFPKPRFTKR